MRPCADDCPRLFLPLPMMLSVCVYVFNKREVNNNNNNNNNDNSNNRDCGGSTMSSDRRNQLSDSFGGVVCRCRGSFACDEPMQSQTHTHLHTQTRTHSNNKHVFSPLSFSGFPLVPSALGCLLFCRVVPSSVVSAVFVVPFIAVAVVMVSDGLSAKWEPLPFRLIFVFCLGVRWISAAHPMLDRNGKRRRLGLFCGCVTTEADPRVINIIKVPIGAQWYHHRDQYENDTMPITNPLLVRSTRQNATVSYYTGLYFTGMQKPTFEEQPPPWLPHTRE